MGIRFDNIPSPCFVLEERKLRSNLELINRVQREAEVEILLAFKGFAMWSVFPIINEYLSGATASSLNEARLGFEEMGKKMHVYAPAYKPLEFEKYLPYTSHLTFNSLTQYHTFKDRVLQWPDKISMALRVNPEYSDVSTHLYNPASPQSRLGLTAPHLQDGLPNDIEGLHFHVLCESSAEALENTLYHFEEKFGHILHQIKWVNMGGGHLMTRKGYEVNRLIEVLKAFKARHAVHVILEPGSAIAWQTGFLRTTVLDIIENAGTKTAVIDASFTCHMPDCIEMPYRPAIRSANLEPLEKQLVYRIGGLSCLAGDFMEGYGFDQPLSVGDTLIFEDMMHYTMVKTNHFNGVEHPGIGIVRNDDTFELIRAFGYEEYKQRLS